MYVDANNLCCWAMSQPQPDDEYKWVSNDDCHDAVAALRNKAFRDRWYNQQKHYIFKVDVDYPPELHDREDDYFLAFDTINIDA